MNTKETYKSSQVCALVLLRIAIGWHFLYEGVVKLMNPNWSALPYLNDSEGIFATLFQGIAANPTMLSLANGLNTFGLIIIGLGLILGLCSRISAIGGIIFLVMYYLSHPPFIGAEYMMPTEGSYLWIDKNIIEICALVVLFLFPTSQIIGIDRFIPCFGKNSKK